MSATVYLAYFDPEGADVEGLEAELVQKKLGDGLYLVETEDTRSRLYHGIKRRLKSDAALLVAPLADAPKFKGLEPGALNWVRARFG